MTIEDLIEYLREVESHFRNNGSPRGECIPEVIASLERLQKIDNIIEEKGRITLYKVGKIEFNGYLNTASPANPPIQQNNKE